MSDPVPRSKAPDPVCGAAGRAERARGLRILSTAYAAILLVWLTDFLSGFAFDVSLSYVFPVVWLTWRRSPRSGLGAAVVSAAADTALDVHLGRYPLLATTILWNMTIALGLLAAAVWGVHRLREKTRSESALLIRLKEAHDRLEAVYAHLDREVEGVADIQRSLLPPAPPVVPGYRFAVHYATSARAGGDYYDALPLADGRLGLLVADVSGHGPPAAVIMAMARVLVHGEVAAQSSPERLLAAVNAGLVVNILLHQFVTACYGVLDPAAGTVEYALAGHPRPILVRSASRGAREIGVPEGPPLGIDAHATYRRQSVSLEPGDSLVVYTDGLTEARPPDGEAFGEEGVLAAIGGPGRLDADSLLSRLTDAMRTHLGGSPNEDDVTIMIVERARPN